MTTYLKAIFVLCIACISLCIPTINKAYAVSLEYPSEIQNFSESNTSSIEIRNIGEDSVRGNFYIFDVYKINGTHRINPSQKRQYQLGKWLKTDEGVIEIASGETYSLNLEFQNEGDNKKIAGDYYGLVMFVEEGAQVPQNEFSGAKIQMHIPGNPEAKISLNVVDSIHNGESLYMVFVNEGTAQGSFKANVKFEESYEKHDILVNELYPGEAESFIITPENAPMFGTLQAKVLGANSSEIGGSELEYASYERVLHIMKYLFWISGLVALSVFIKSTFLDEDDFVEETEYEDDDEI